MPKIALMAADLGIEVQVMWRKGCSTRGLEVADWVSRLVQTMADLPRFGIKWEQLKGLKFDLEKFIMTLPNGRTARISMGRLGGPLKLGFNFTEFFMPHWQYCRINDSTRGRKRKV